MVVAHGDDETLGAGATLARLSDAGVRIRLCVLTDDDGSRHRSPHRAANRSLAVKEAARILGIAEVAVHGHGDNRLDRVGQLELNRLVEVEIRAFGPDTVLTSSLADLNQDHRLVSSAVRVAARPGRSGVGEIRCFEVRSATDWGEASGIRPSFSPNCWQAVSEEHLERKLAALRAYGQEVEPWPLPRSEGGVRALAAYRGSQVAVPLAEAFETPRVVHV
ncbi:PIG-L deacetylase family protein [Streptomyces sp. TRM 70361]|uniref:PIG-L deacetylase family protein n=1 Tax=Streptomyces sp. TRM 70361 TaxID=3116553 RepID=UPI002E7B6039|nr:PIG-L deacetylase family protein [Streptomyces sp. TRM 70361]MEE1942748.1 PIG-L deacetylase family protein [Streptomyces sp. TRM 70361]